MTSVLQKRRNAKSPETIKQHFEEIKEAKISHEVADKDVYNFDKIGFRVCYRKQLKVIIKGEKACVFLKNLKNRDFITSIKCVNNNRSAIPNMIILSRKSYLEKNFLYND